MQAVAVPAYETGLGLEDAPRRLRNTADKLAWLRVYDSAYAAYDGKKTATEVANKVTWDNEHRTAKWGRKIEMPDLGNTIELGTMLEVHFMVKGIIVMDKFRGPKAPTLLWSTSQREDQAEGSLYTFPGLKISSITAPPANFRRLSNLYGRWHAGTAAARGASKVGFPVPTLSAATSCVAVVYRSDKFSPGRMVDYIHHVENGVRARMGPVRRSSDGAPQAFYIAGGRMKLTERGLEH